MAAELRIVNTDTGEVTPGDHLTQRIDELEILVEQLQAELKGKSLQIGNLKRENRDLRAVEPEAEQIREVLEYWRERCKPRATISIDGKRWKAVRARLKDRLEDRPPWTPEELMLTVDGALLDPFWNGTSPKSRGKGFVLEAESIFGTPERVEHLRDLALGFQGTAGIHLRGLLEVAADLRVVNWKHLLRVCSCGHRRVEHAHGDPAHEGAERCFECDCVEFDEDAFSRMESDR